MNVFSFTGNLGKDAQIRDAAGTPVASFSVAVKSGYGEREQTLWIDCSLFGKITQSKLIDYLKKGQRVEVSGELGTREYDGRTFLTCRVNSISLGGSKNDNQQSTRPAAKPSSSFDDMDDSIPF